MDSSQSDGAQATDTPPTPAGSPGPSTTPDVATRQTRRNRLTLIVGLALIAITVAATVYTKRRADDRASLIQQDAQLAPTKVTVYNVARQHIPMTLDVRGFLRGFIEASVYAEVAGRVVERMVSDGDSLEPGQILCQIDDTFHRLAVQQARARLQSAQAEGDKARAGVDVAAAHVEVVHAEKKQAQIEFDRIKRLFQEQTSPKIEYDRAETELQRASAAATRAQALRRRTTHERGAASAAIAQAQAQLDQANETLRRCTIRSTTAGRIDTLLIEQGQYVTVGQPIADVVQLNRLKLIVEVEADKLAWLGDDPSVQVVVDSQPDRYHRATVHHVAPRANSVSRRFPIELHVDNPDGALLSGMFAQARFSTATPRELLVLPSNAVLRRFGQNYCHVAAPVDGKLQVHLRAIQIKPVPQHRDLLQVVDGLTPGEQVIVDAQGELRDGSPITIVATSAQTQGLAYTPQASLQTSQSPGG